MDHATTTEILETNADVTVGARRFLARVKPRMLRTETGRVITTTELAESLVKRADLEHAVLPGTRPRHVVCVTCPTLIEVAPRGAIPVRCHECRIHGRRPTIACVDCGGPADCRAKSKRCAPCVAAAKTARHKCVACSAKVGRRSDRCRPCALRLLHGSSTPEQRSARSRASQAVRTQEQRRAEARHRHEVASARKNAQL